MPAKSASAPSMETSEAQAWLEGFVKLGEKLKVRLQLKSAAEAA